MAQVEILSETEEAACWIFQVQVLDDAGELTQHRVRLSWADYNLWSDGSVPPAVVAEAVMHFLLSQTSPAELAASFDASLARRRYEHADARIPAYIRP